MKIAKQAGAELGQAQLKLGLDFDLIRVDLVSLDLVWLNWSGGLNRFVSVHLVQFIWFFTSNILICRFSFVYSVWWIWVNIFGLVPKA